MERQVGRYFRGADFFVVIRTGHKNPRDVRSNLLNIENIPRGFFGLGFDDD